MIMNIFFRILIFLAITVLPQETLLLYKNGKPTSKGIDKYVNDSSTDFIDEFQSYVKDTLYNDVYITTTDLSKLADYDKNELGYTEIHSNGYEIVITNQRKFADYSINTLTKRGGKKDRNEYDQFVKSVVFHELMHVYFRQIMQIEIMHEKLNHYFYNVQLVPNAEMQYGSTFIEEGLCEYLIRNKGEIMECQTKYVPKIINDLFNKENVFRVQYEYSSYYLQNFMDSCTNKYGSMKPAIKILLENNPPNYQEILNSNIYFSRFK
jgi:hypothetical protein